MLNTGSGRGLGSRLVALLAAVAVMLGMGLACAGTAQAAITAIEDFKATVNYTKLDENDFNTAKTYHIGADSDTGNHSPHFVGTDKFMNDWHESLKKLNSYGGLLRLADTPRAYDWGKASADNTSWPLSPATNVQSIEVSATTAAGKTITKTIPFVNETWNMYFEVKDKDGVTATFKTQIPIKQAGGMTDMSYLIFVSGRVTEAMNTGLINSTRLPLGDSFWNDPTVGSRVPAEKNATWKAEYGEGLNTYTTYFTNTVDMGEFGQQTVMIPMINVIDVNCAGCLTYALDANNIQLVNHQNVKIAKTSTGYVSGKDAGQVTFDMTGAYTYTRTLDLDASGAGSDAFTLDMPTDKTSFSVTVKERGIADVDVSPAAGHTIEFESKDAVAGVTSMKVWRHRIDGGAWSDYGQTVVLDFQNTFKQPDLQVTKTADKQSANLGDTITYTVKVENKGAGSAKAAEVTDTLGDNLEFVSASGNGKNTDQTVKWTGVTLASGASTEFTVKAKVMDSAKEQVVNKATACEGSNCTPTPCEGDSCTAITPLTPDLQVTKTADKQQANLGDTITYTVKVENKGAATAKSAEVTDTLGDNLEFVAASDNGVNTGQTVKWTGLTLAPGASKSFTVAAKVGASALEQVVNKATACEGEGCTPVPCEGDSCQAITELTPDLQVTKTADKQQANLGDTITYTVTVENKGSATAKAAEVTDTLGDNLEFVSASDNGVNTGRTVKWTGLTLAPGESKSFTVTAKVGASALEQVVNKATACDGGDCVPVPCTDDSCQAITELAPALQVTKTADRQSANLGDTISYEVTVRNAGGGTAKNTTVTDTLGKGLEFVSASDDAVNSGGEIVWSGLTLAPGESRSFTVKAKVTAEAEGQVVNEVTALDPADPNGPANASAAVSVASVALARTGADASVLTVLAVGLMVVAAGAAGACRRVLR